MDGSNSISGAKKRSHPTSNLKGAFVWLSNPSIVLNFVFAFESLLSFIYFIFSFSISGHI